MVSETEIRPEPDAELTAMLDHGLAPEARRAVTVVATLGERRGLPVYLVGGPVRDLLLERATADVDLMIEGELEDLARSIASELGGKPRYYPDFLTAAIDLPNGLEVDLASARVERYAAPGVLPAVRAGSLAEDLARRDFAANALALRVGAEGALGLIDHHDGRRDIDRRRLRVLHQRSFEDDPTRILRGVRFETRLGFRFDSATESLARAAIGSGLLECVSGARLRREWTLLLAEPGAPASLARLADLGGLLALDPALEMTDATRSLLEQVAAAFEWARGGDRGAETAEPWRLFLLALAWSHPGLDAERLAARLDLGAVDRVRLSGCRERLAAARRGLSDPDLPPHGVSSALRGLAVEELLVLRALGGAGAGRVEDELVRYRRLELRIDGADLLERGHLAGPAIGRALEATRDARLDGRIAVAEELEFALDVLEHETERERA